MPRNADLAPRSWRRGKSSAAVSAAASQRLAGRLLFSVLTIALVALLVYWLQPPVKQHTHALALCLTEADRLAVPPLPWVLEDLAWAPSIDQTHQSRELLEKWVTALPGPGVRPADSLMVYIAARGVCISDGRPCLVTRDFPDPERGLFPVRNLLDQLASNETAATLVVFDCGHTLPDHRWGWQQPDFTTGLAKLMPEIRGEFADRLWVLAATDDGQVGANLHGLKHSLFGEAWQSSMESVARAGENDGEIRLLDFVQSLQKTCTVWSGGRQTPRLFRAGQGVIEPFDFRPQQTGDNPLVWRVDLPPEMPASEQQPASPDQPAAAVTPRKTAGTSRPSGVARAAIGLPHLLTPAAWMQAETSAPASPAPATPSGSIPAASPTTGDRPSAVASTPNAAPAGANPEQPAPVAAPPDDPQSRPDTVSTRPESPPAPPGPAPGTAASGSIATAANTESLLDQIWKLRDDLQAVDRDPRTSPLIYAPQVWRTLNAELLSLEARSLAGACYDRDVRLELELVLRDLSDLARSQQALEAMETTRMTGVCKPIAAAWSHYVAPDGTFAFYRAQQVLPAASAAVNQYAITLNQLLDLAELSGRMQLVQGGLEPDFRPILPFLLEFRDQWIAAEELRLTPELQQQLESSRRSLADWSQQSLKPYRTIASDALQQIQLPDVHDFTGRLTLELLLTSPVWDWQTRRDWRQVLRTPPSKMPAVPFDTVPPRWRATETRIRDDAWRELDALWNSLAIESPAARSLREFSAGIRTQDLQNLPPATSHLLASLIDARDARRVVEPLPPRLQLLPQRDYGRLQLIARSPEKQVLDLDRQPQDRANFEVRWEGSPDSVRPQQALIQFDFSSETGASWCQAAVTSAANTGSAAPGTPYVLPLENDRATFTLSVQRVAGQMRKTARDPASVAIRLQASSVELAPQIQTVNVTLPILRTIDLLVSTPSQGLQTSAPQPSPVPQSGSVPRPDHDRQSLLTLQLHANRQSSTRWALANPAPVARKVDVTLLAVSRHDSAWNWPLGKLGSGGGVPFPELTRTLVDSSGRLRSLETFGIIAESTGLELPADAPQVAIPWRLPGQTAPDPAAPKPEQPPAMPITPVTHGLACVVRDAADASQWDIHWIELAPLRPDAWLQAVASLRPENEDLQLHFDVSLLAEQTLPGGLAERPFLVEWPFRLNFPSGTEVRASEVLTAELPHAGLYARFPGERNQSTTTTSLHIDGWPRAFRFEIPRAAITNPQERVIRTLKPTQAVQARRVELIQVRDQRGSATAPTRRYFRHPELIPKADPDATGPRPVDELWPLRESGKAPTLFFAAASDLQLAVEYEADGPDNAFGGRFSDWVEFEFDGKIQRVSFADRFREISCQPAAGSATGELQFTVRVSDFTETVIARGANRRATLVVRMMNGQTREEMARDEIAIALDGLPPLILDARTEGNRDTLDVTATFLARDQEPHGAGLDPESIRAALVAEGQEVNEKNLISAVLQGDGRYLVRFKTAEIEEKLRQKRYKVVMTATDHVGHTTTTDLEVALPVPKPTPMVAMKEPPKPKQDGVIRGVVTYPSGKEAAGLTVILEGTDRTAVSDGNGAFQFTGLDPDKPATLTVSEFFVSGRRYAGTAMGTTVSATAKSIPAVRLVLKPAAGK